MANKPDTYYFSHDATAKDDPKCVMLIEQLGLEGYGIFWVLVETLRAQPDYKYPLNLVSAIARRYNTSAEKMNTVIKNYDLFKIEDECFFSLRLLRNMEVYNAKKIKYIEAGRSGGQASVKRRLSNRQAIKGNKRKGKEIKDSSTNVEQALAFESENFKIIWEKWKQHRKSKKKPLSQGAIEEQQKFLKQYKEHQAVQIIETSMRNDWQGLFHPKDGFTEQPESSGYSKENMDFFQEYCGQKRNNGNEQP